MNVFAIYLNDTEGMILVCAHSEERAMELFKTSKWSPVHLNGIDLEDVKIDCYPTKMYKETNIEGFEDYCISTGL